MRKGGVKRLQRFRADVEARISLLKRKFGLKQSLLGAALWGKYMGRSEYIRP